MLGWGFGEDWRMVGFDLVELQGGGDEEGVPCSGRWGSVLLRNLADLAKHAASH